MTITAAELKRLEDAEYEARAVHKKAQAAANDARAEMARQKLADAGITINETVVLAPRWGFSSAREKIQCLVIDVTVNGAAYCHQITSGGKLHGGTKPFACDLNDLSVV